MPSFESDLGSKKFKAPAMKELDIPDETNSRMTDDEFEDNAAKIQELQERMHKQQHYHQTQQQDISDVEREIRIAREAKRSGKERLNEGARRRIEMLIGMTRTTHTAEIEGNVFIFQTLKAKEMREAIIAASEFDGSIESPFEIRKQLLARSLIEISGVPVEQFIGSARLEDKLLFIEELDEALLNRLYDEYIKLAREAKKKYSIKSDEEAQQVVEDLKK